MDARTGSGDKRLAPRYSARGARARLAWKVGDVCQTLNLRLEDISMGGLAAVAPALPPPVDPLWVGLMAGPAEEWVEVAVVNTRRNRNLLFLPSGDYLVRLRFKETCSFDFFKRAVRGFAREFDSQGPAPEDLRWFNSQSWR